MVQRRPARVERRLSAILAADVAGYSRLMHNEEEATHAQPRGICISSSAYDQVQGKVGVEFADLGEQTVKSIPPPVRVFALSSSAIAALPTPSSLGIHPDRVGTDHAGSGYCQLSRQLP
jgi:class 3 adenylate cyclase